MSDSNTFQLNNPNLMNPMNNGQSVPPLAGITKAFPVVHLAAEEESKYYVCTMPNHHMHRQDGKRLAFVFGVLATRDVYDIMYMDNEIKFGTPFIREATPDEIHIYKMRIDPKGTMTKEITPEIEQRVRVELTAELTDAILHKLSSVGVQLTEEQTKALKPKSDAPEDITNGEDNLKTVDVMERLKARLGKGITTKSGTVFAGHALNTQSHYPVGVGVPLQGIVGTDRLPNAATSDGMVGGAGGKV